MTLVLLTDLHIKSGDTPNDILWLNHFCEWVRCNSGEKIIICIMGDIIHCGNEAAFDAADNIFDDLKKQLSGARYGMLFLPGNHDYCDKSLTRFDAFCEKYQSKEFGHFKYEVEKTHSIDVDDINLILVDSIDKKNYSSAGRLNIDEIKKHVKADKQNILLLHHSLISEDGSSHSGVVEQENVLNALDRLGIKYVFHGHTHATRTFAFSNGVLLSGAGSIGVEQQDLTDLVNEQEQFISVYFHENKIESIQNWQYRGGAERYISYQLYPETSKLFDDPLRFPIRRYDDAVNYIDRTVLSREKLSSNPLIRALDKDNGVSLSDAVMKEKWVLLIADAGLGKTTELQHLAHTISVNNPYLRPIRVSLNCYDGEDIQAYIQTHDNTYGQIDPAQFLLILDGYDEIGNSAAFKRKLCQHLKQYPNVHVCISMRSNFLASTTDVFKDFSAYQLMDLDQESIENYLSRKGIDADTFFAECRRKDLTRIVANPFYLEHLVEHFGLSETLPVRKDLMASITEQCLKKDCEKFDYALEMSLEDKTHDLSVALVRMGYLLQLLRSTYCTEKQYQAMLPQSDRNILQYSSYTVKHPKGRMFSHNIFREYFVAKYLSNKRVDEITRVMSIEGTEYFDQNWLQVLGFVLQLKNDPHLIDWVFQHEPLALTKLEACTVSDGLRQQVLEKTIAMIDAENIWFDSGTCSLEELAVFSQSEASLKLLLDRITNPIHFRSQYFALSLLQHFTDLWGHEKEVVRILVECYQSNDVRDHEKQVAIQALAMLGLATDEMTRDLVCRFTKDTSGYTRLGVYRYLKIAGIVNENVDFVLRGVQYISLSYDDDEHGIDRWALQECLDDIATPTAISRAIDWCSDKEHMNADGLPDEKLFERHVDRAAVLYKQGHEFLFENVYGLFLSASKNFCQNYIDAAIRFFRETSTLTLALEKLACSEDDNDWFALDQLITKEEPLLGQFCELYEQDKLITPAWFEKFAWRNRYNTAIFGRCRELVYKKTGRMMDTPDPRTNFSQKWVEDKQYFFDALFEKSKMSDIVSALVSVYDNPKLKVCDIQQFRLRDFNHPLGTRELTSVLIRSDLAEELVSDFLEVIDWDSFVLKRMTHYFCTERNKEKLRVTDDQKTYIRTRYDQLLQNEDFHTSVKEHDDQYSCSTNLYTYWTWKKYFDFSIADDVCVGLLEVPHFILGYHNPEEKYDVIEKQIDKEVIRERIISLLPKETRPAVLTDLIAGCKRYKISDGEIYAIGLCLDQKRYQSERECAADYLIDVFGMDYLLSEVAHQMDCDVLGYVIDKNGDLQSDILNKILVEKYAATKSYKLLSRMICRNLPEGLESYYNIVKERGRSENQGMNNHDILRTVSITSDPRLVPIIMNLVQLRYTDGFVDTAFYSLGSALRSALLKCAEQDYVCVWESVLRLKESMLDNIECVGFCSQMQRDLLQKHKERLIIIKPLSEIAEIIKTIA